MNQIKFSVVIPTYHRNDLLAKCLDCLAPSVQTLSAEQYEVIVTDDGSQTTAQEMIQQFYPWVKWIAGTRKGPAANRNNGAKYAQGKWIVFTDDDCLPKREWLASFASAITPNVYVYEGKTTCEIGINSPLEHAPVNLTGGYLWSCNMMIENSLFSERLKGFDENFPYPHMEDVDLRERIKSDIYPVIIFVECAIVDHPPKRVPWGDKISNLHESYIYWYCKNNAHPSQSLLFNITVKNILRFRLAAILNHPVSTDSFLAILSMVVELIWVIFKFRDWSIKYDIPSKITNPTGI